MHKIVADLGRDHDFIYLWFGNAFAINSSLNPFPYVSAASNNVIPRSNALMHKRVRLRLGISKTSVCVMTLRRGREGTFPEAPGICYVSKVIN